MPSKQQFGLSGFVIRLAFAAILVFATYNPSEYSFFSWVMNSAESPMVYKALAGIALLIGWVIFLRATINSLGVIGIILTSVLLACLVWLLVEWNVFDPTNRTAMTWTIEVVVAFLLATGMSWSHIRRQMSGQYDTDEIEG